jgi:hypothetical protein
MSIYDKYKGGFSRKGEITYPGNRYVPRGQRDQMNNQNWQFPEGPNITTIRKNLDKLMPKNKDYEENKSAQDIQINDRFLGKKDVNVITVKIDYYVGDLDGKFEVKMHIENQVSSLIEICKRKLSEVYLLPEDSKFSLTWCSRILDPDVYISKLGMKDGDNSDFTVLSNSNSKVRSYFYVYL